MFQPIQSHPKRNGQAAQKKNYSCKTKMSNPLSFLENHTDKSRIDSLEKNLEQQVRFLHLSLSVFVHTKKEKRKNR